MSVPYWIPGRDTNAKAWDVIWLGDKKLPGQIKDFVIDTKNSLDVGKAQGNSGAPVTPKGRMPRTMSFSMQITTKEQWDEWDDVLKHLNLNGSDVLTRPFSVAHPQAAKIGLTSVYIESFKQPWPNVVNGNNFSFNLIENIPAKPIKTGAASKKPGPVTDFGSSGFPPPSNALNAAQPRRGG